MPSNFVNVLGLQLLVMFIGYHFTKQEFGYFGLANMLILLPISFISQSVSSILFQKATVLYNDEEFHELRKTFFQTSKLLLAIGLPGFLICFLEENGFLN